MTAPRSRADWLALGALLAFVAGRCLVPMDETDLFFNLRLGEIILRTHHVPRTNLLSFTFPDHREINLAWVFQILLALAHRAGGVAGTVVLKTAFVVATFAVLWRVGRRRGAHPAALAAALALAAWTAEPRFVERPHLVTFLGLALTLLALERAEAGRPRALYALVPAGLIWANANSCFFLAPAVLLLYAAGARADGRRADARRAALVAAALLPLTFATPARADAWLYIANHVRMPYLRPLQEYRTAAWPVDGPFFFLAAATSLTAALAGRGRLRGFLPAAALGLLGWRRIRFVAEFALLAGPTVAAAATAAWRARVAGSVTARADRAATLAAAAALLALAAGPRLADARAGGRWLDLGREPDLVPEAAIRFAERHGLRERMYNDLEVGSYLAWDGWPRYPVFQDPRINSYPEQLHAVLRRADLSRPEWDALMDRFAVTSALITYPSQNPRAALFDPARWALVYRAPDALLFARRAPARDALLAAEELPLTFAWDDERGLLPSALPAQPAGSPVPACEWSRRTGDVLLERGDADGARRAYEAAVREPRCLEAARGQTTMRALGALALGRGDAAAAASIYGAVPGPEARTGRAFALLGLGRAGDALAALDQAPTARADDADALLARGLALADLGRADDAAAALGAFLRAAPQHVGAPGARARLAQLARARGVSPPATP
jgi:hypothetical protein